MALGNWRIESLFLVPAEDGTDEDGSPIFCVFNQEIDAVTFIDTAERESLISRGIETLESLPE